MATWKKFSLASLAMAIFLVVMFVPPYFVACQDLTRAFMGFLVLALVVGAGLAVARPRWLMAIYEKQPHYFLFLAFLLLPGSTWTCR